MATKTKAVDADIDEFRYFADLTLDPPLSDSAAKGASTEFFKLKQIKDEDVVMDPVEGIKVISRNVTQVQPAIGPEQWVYGTYDEMKKGLVAIAKVAASNGSTLTGQVIVWGQGVKFFRLLPDSNGKVNVDRANLSWPDGTSSIIPDAWSD